MNEASIVEIWDIIKDYCDKKQMNIIAEKFVDVLSENGFSDNNLENLLGNDDDLDDAIKNLLDIGDDETEDFNYDDE
jgi:hypothetical protein